MRLSFLRFMCLSKVSDGCPPPPPTPAGACSSCPTLQRDFRALSTSTSRLGHGLSGLSSLGSLASPDPFSCPSLEPSQLPYALLEVAEAKRAKPSR